VTSLSFLLKVNEASKTDKLNSLVSQYQVVCVMMYGTCLSFVLLWSVLVAGQVTYKLWSHIIIHFLVVKYQKIHYSYYS
jgi:hypothetical protein